MDLKKLDNQTFIAVVVVVAFVLVIFAWMFFPPKNVDQAILTVVNMLIGALISNVNTVISFFFGSSKGSKDKDDALTKIATGPDAPVPVVTPGPGTPPAPPATDAPPKPAGTG